MKKQKAETPDTLEKPVQKDKKAKKAGKGKKGEKGKKGKKVLAAAAAESPAEVDPAPGDEPKELSGKAYEKELKKLHAELVQLQEWVKAKGLKVCIVFEGRDAAGKGGVIKAITERVSPRVFRVFALPAPTDREKTEMYMQRYMRLFPAAGEVAIFDRSWYNRAGVERVLGFCTEAQSKKFLASVPWAEKAMVDSGIILIKFWLEVSEDAQAKRLEDRIDDGRKLWKLSPMDLKSFNRWYDYSRARDEMFAATDTEFAPWHVVRSDDKRKARLNVIAHILDHVPYQRTKAPKVKLPKRQKKGNYREPDYPYRYVAEKY